MQSNEYIAMLRLWISICIETDQTAEQAMTDPHSDRGVHGAVKYINVKLNKAVWISGFHNINYFKAKHENWKGPSTGLWKNTDGIVDGGSPYCRMICQRDILPTNPFDDWPDRLLSTIWIVILENTTNVSLAIAVVRAGVNPALNNYPAGHEFKGDLISAPGQLQAFINQYNLEDRTNTGSWISYRNNTLSDDDNSKDVIVID